MPRRRQIDTPATYTTSICTSQRPACCDHTWPYPDWKTTINRLPNKTTTMVHRCDHDTGHDGPHTCGCGAHTP